MLALIWVAFLSPLAGEFEYQANLFRESKGRTFAQTQDEFGMVSADEHYAAVQLPESY